MGRELKWEGGWVPWNGKVRSTAKAHTTRLYFLVLSSTLLHPPREQC